MHKDSYQNSWIHPRVKITLGASPIGKKIRTALATKKYAASMLANDLLTMLNAWPNKLTTLASEGTTSFNQRRTVK